MQLITSEHIKEEKVKDKLLDALQVFSTAFQKTVLLRYALNDNPLFYSITQQHADEEYRHDLILNKARSNRPITWDAILDAAVNWFNYKMMTLDDYGKTLLVHFVLEKSAIIFFEQADKVLSDKTNYFKIHAEVDGSHENMGHDLLEELTPPLYRQLATIQKQGWDMVNLATNRIAELAINTESRRFPL